MSLLPPIISTIVMKILIRVCIDSMHGSLLLVQMLHDHDLNTIKHVAHNLYKLKDVAPTALDKAAHGAPQQLLSAAKTSSVVKMSKRLPS